MFELMHVKLANMLKSTKRLGLVMRKLLMRAERGMNNFEEDLKLLKENIEKGDPEGVLNSFQKQADDFRQSVDSVISSEETVALYLHKVSQQIKKEVDDLREIGSKLLKMRIAPELYTDADCIKILESKKISNDKDFQDYLKRSYGGFIKELDIIHSRIQKALGYLEEKTTHQRWNERFEDLLGGTGFASYKALQSGRALKFTTKDVTGDIDHTDRDITQMQSFTKESIQDAKELKRFFESEKRINEELKEEESDLNKMLEYVGNIVNFCVYLFFEVMKEYAKLKSEEDVLSKERFPEEFIKQMNEKLDVLQKHVRDETLDARRVSSQARGQA